MIDWRESEGTTATSTNAHAEVANAPLGSCDHVRATLIRARPAICAARARTQTSRTVLARAEALVGASAELVQASLALHAELRASITACVRRLHADGLPAERVLVRVKAAVREAMPSELEPSEARDLMEDAVRWTIEAYYRAA